MAVDVVSAAQAEYEAWVTSKKAAAERATVSTDTGLDGNSTTEAVSNDSLSNSDFLKLMLEEMKQQDPTSPMDSSALMDSQLKMSTIQSNQDMATAMTALQTSYAASALSTAANLIGTSVKTGEIGDNGEEKIFAVTTVENQDGELYVNAKQITGSVNILLDENDNAVQFDSNGKIYVDGKTSDYTIAFDDDGNIKYNTDKTITLLDKDGKEVVYPETETEESANLPKYTYEGGYQLLYADETVTLPVSSISSIS